MHAETVSAAKLTLHPENPRRADIARLAESLREHGQYKPLVVQRSTGYVLAGNHTLLAARELGWDDIAVVYLDIDDLRARKILLMDNRVTDNASYDNDALLELLASLDNDFTGTGYSPEDLDDLLAALDQMPVLPRQQTDAAFGETEEELQARQDRFAGAQPRAQLGMRDVILIYTQAQYEEFQDLVRLLRGTDETAGDVVLAALRHNARQA
jgi:hypothetical protein